MSTLLHRRASAPFRRHESIPAGQVLSSEEKRALILAHHESHKRSKRKVPAGAYYVGIAASCLVVISGWWLTFGSHIGSGVRQKPDEAAQILQEQYQKYFSATSTAPKKDLKTMLEEAKQAAKTAEVNQLFEQVTQKMQTVTTSTK
ncbi:MAG TPA: hypothetical protein VFQ60_03685 [Patescibacteria group bacterium]|nr:hypothetical protein [Patescibacteria group bacterium]